MPKGKRIILCLDGTWVNSDKGYNRPTLGQPDATLQVPTNVTRVYRSLKKRDANGKNQVMYYHPGVGTTGNITDEIAGGVFGSGVSENIREAYSFAATNYEPGDDIIIVGFSRGAFTARSVAGLITEIGLLNNKGMELLYPIFKDIENIRNPRYKDEFPTTPFPGKPRDKREYRHRLEEEDLTRLYDPDGRRIKIRCVAVWETVGSLGIPDTNLSNKLKIPRSTKECKFYDTSLSNGIEYAFQALALEEDRTSFAPCVWNRPRNVRTDLRQVWFLGAHSNVGGGLPDQELANIAMAWMMDQLTSIGVAFEDDTIDRIFQQSVRYFFSHPHPQKSQTSSKHKPWSQWAVSSVYNEHRPVRPWGLGEIVQPETGYYHLAGKTTRTPGMYHYVDPNTALSTPEFLTHTHESVHRSVRIRLTLEGLGYDDVGLYKCSALKDWKLERMRVVSRRDTRYSGGTEEEEEIVEKVQDHRWGWVYVGPERDTPPKAILMEEPLGPYEDRLLHLNKGRPFYKAMLAESRRP